MQHSYDHNQISGMLLYTSHEVMLDDLISRPIQSGDVLSNANTIIMVGKVRNGNSMVEPCMSPNIAAARVMRASCRTKSLRRELCSNDRRSA